MWHCGQDGDLYIVKIAYCLDGITYPASLKEHRIKIRWVIPLIEYLIGKDDDCKDPL